MIQANELRIGNFVLDRGKPVSLKGSQLVNIITGKYVDMYQPIPLTEEILFKCGFSKSYDEAWDLNFYGITYSDGMGYQVSYFLSEGCFMFIGYKEIPIAQGVDNLHQLQNLYFALTGEELTVNL